MNKLIALLFAAAAVTSASAGTSVGVSIDINQPGVYGRINIGNVAPPMVVYPQPVIIMRLVAITIIIPTAITIIMISTLAVLAATLPIRS